MRGRWQGLVPGLVIGFGIVAATIVAKQLGGMAAGPVVLAIAILLADAVAAGEQGAPRRPSLGAWILAAVPFIVSAIMNDPSPRAMGESMALLGTTAWIVLLLPNSRPRRCLPRRS